MVNFDPESVERLSAFQKRRILLEGRELFVFFAIIIFLLGVMIIAGGEGVWGMWFVILAIVLVFISASRILLMSPKKQKEFISNQLLEKAIRRTERETGEIISEAERDQLRFKYDPTFRAKVEKRASKRINQTHQAKVDHLVAELQILEEARAAELARLEQMRWQQACHKDLKYSLRDGKLQLNQNLICNFTDLERAQLILKVGTRDTKRVSRVGITAHSKNSYDKLRNKVDHEVGKRLQDPHVEEILPEVDSSENPTLPPIVATRKVTTCEYLAVRIYFKDHTTTEIILLPSVIDWHKRKCQNSYRTAWQLLQELEILINTPMPEQVIQSQDEPSIRELDKQIEKAKQSLEEVKSSVPTAEIPERYLSPSSPKVDNSVAEDLAKAIAEKEAEVAKTAQKTAETTVVSSEIVDKTVPEEKSASSDSAETAKPKTSGEFIIPDQSLVESTKTSASEESSASDCAKIEKAVK